ncbi:ankyrin repeat ph and sec7 domain containing protein secg-related [Anaeramoeba ignava]|uniref:Ankyrin repeat ph and sec7 domain containing protein secg-related n=1 Tax=Anaeramoeba ignava TaxID=1746090 RepID=A0A9Q0LBZ7_ANAIG|nr:ankyrin repeat ph and sec7 domain containing protein secg-related [Anaeramoeba ignava]
MPKTNQNQTALHLICKFNSILIIKYLVSKGIDINAKTNENETALSISIKKQNENVIKFLLMNDVNIDNLKQKHITKQFIELFSQIYSLNEDMNNLLKSNDNFSDLIIQSNDSFKFKVHKLILLSRFDNNELILQKFINNCYQKPKEEVEIILNFLYTGFSNFDKIIQLKNENENEMKNIKK